MRAAFSFTSNFSPIHTGLDNWKMLWITRFNLNLSENSKMQSFDVGMWKRPGFMRHAPEFWLLARLFLERLSTENTASDFTGNTVSPASLSGGLVKYDESDMSQVKSLIYDFKHKLQGCVSVEI
jgi:hypothetical protein